MIATVLKEYGFNIIDCDVQSFGSGLINNTWVVIKDDEKFICNASTTKFLNSRIILHIIFGWLQIICIKIFPIIYLLHRLKQ
ncbi:MAG: hypothetical protein WDM90_00110 [Ferruginibacter sp.]